MADNLALFSNRILRSAIRHNRVSYPAQEPVFHGDETQARMAHLYFVCNWRIRDLATRYSIDCENTRKTLNDWRARATSSGYIQEIELDGDNCPVAEVEQNANADEREERPPTFSIIRRSSPVITHRSNTMPASRGVSDSPRAMLVNEIEAGARTTERWPSFCLRLLSILKEDCARVGFRVAAAQIQRIETTEERNAELARDLLRDLRTRISDEENVSVLAGRNNGYTSFLLCALVSEIETGVKETRGDRSLTADSWPAYCSRLLTAVKTGCAVLGLRFTATQVERIEDAVSTGTGQLPDLVRDLTNRMSDEVQYAKAVDQPVIGLLQIAAGAGR